MSPGLEPVAPEGRYEDNLEGSGAVTKESYMRDVKVGTHYLKCHPIYFMMVSKGEKPFEIRKNDRNFQVGDKVVLCEWDPILGKDREAEGYTGCSRDLEILSIVPSQNGIAGPGDEAIVPGFVVLGLRLKP